MLSTRHAADLLLAGGVIAYPTEGVFGLGCLPDDTAAVERILAIKNRAANKGLILIAASADQFDGWIDPEHREKIPEPNPRQPVTWICRPSAQVPGILTGEHPGLAVRVTTNPVAAAICNAVDMPIVSTSANKSGRPVARNAMVLQRQFGGLVDYVVPGRCGPATGPSEIRDMESGMVLRPGKA